MENLGFYLQDAYVKDWIDNTMVFMEVDDVYRWWENISSLDLPAKYPGVRLVPVRTEDWGPSSLYTTFPAYCGTSVSSPANLSYFSPMNDSEILAAFHARRSHYDAYLGANDIAAYTCPGCGFPSLAERGYSMSVMSANGRTTGGMTRQRHYWMNCTWMVSVSPAQTAVFPFLTTG